MAKVLSWVTEWFAPDSEYPTLKSPLTVTLLPNAIPVWPLTVLEEPKAMPNVPVILLSLPIATPPVDDTVALFVLPIRIAFAPSASFSRPRMIEPILSAAFK